MSMFNVLIVDDEPLFRLALRALIADSGLPLHIAAEAADGQEALQWIESNRSVDIVLADMKMPRMDGIEFLRQLPALYLEGVTDRPPVVIALSAYQDYGFVREAFLLGAMDYMVKVDMDENHVLPVLDKALRHLRQRQASPLAAAGAEAAKPSRDKALLDALAGSAGAPSDLPAGNRVLAVVSCEAVPDGAAWRPDSESPISGDPVRRTIEQVLQSDDIEADILRKDQREYILFIELRHSRSLLYCRNRLNECLGTIQRRLAQFANISVSIGVSGPHDSLSWGDMYREAEAFAAHRFFCGYGKIVYAESVQTWGHRLARAAAEENAFPASAKAVIESLNEADSGVWKERLADWRKNALPYPAEETVRARFNDVLWELGVFLHGRSHRWDQLEEPFRQPFQLLQQCDTLERMWATVEELLARIHTLLHQSPATGNYVLHRAKTYIANHYRDGITLTLVSEMVGVSDSHLSKLFVKETGEKFIDYVTKLRVAKAAELTKTGMKLYEIAENVGYLNAEHFSRVFKKTTGLSPIQYRDRWEQEQKTSSK